MGRDHVARHDRTDAGRRAGIDEIAGRECYLLRQLCDDFRNIPDHLADIAALALRPVDGKRDRTMFEMLGVLLRDRPAWRRGIEALADLPWQPHVAGVELTVAAGEIDADGIAPDQAIGFLNGDVPPALAKRDDQLDLELEIRCERRIRNARAIEHDRIARLLEEERRISLVGLLHLLDVIEIVAA